MPRKLSTLGFSGLLALAVVVGGFSTVDGQVTSGSQYPAFGAPGGNPSFGATSAFPAFGSSGGFPAFGAPGSNSSYGNGFQAYGNGVQGSYVPPGMSVYGAPPGASPPNMYYNGKMGPYSPVPYSAMLVPRGNESPGGNAQYATPYYNNTQPYTQPALPGGTNQPAQPAAGAQLAPPYGYVYMNSNNRSLGTAQVQPYGAYGFTSVGGVSSSVGTSTVTGPATYGLEYNGIGYGQYGMPAAPGVTR